MSYIYIHTEKDTESETEGNRKENISNLMNITDYFTYQVSHEMHRELQNIN